MRLNRPYRPDYKLSRIKITEKSGEIRTESCVGDFDNSPTLGRGFMFYGKPLERGDIRVIYTSDVVSVDGVFFTTKSGSVYELVKTC